MGALLAKSFSDLETFFKLPQSATVIAFVAFGSFMPPSFDSVSDPESAPGLDCCR
jgi:hypothetical protein